MQTQLLIDRVLEHFNGLAYGPEDYDFKKSVQNLESALPHDDEKLPEDFQFLSLCVAVTEYLLMFGEDPTKENLTRNKRNFYNMIQALPEDVRPAITLEECMAEGPTA